MKNQTLLFKYLKAPKISVQLTVWFLLVTLVPFLLVVLISLRITEEAMKNEATSNLTSIALSKANRIEEYINERKRDVHALAHMPGIVDVIDKLNEGFRKYGVDSPEYIAIDKAFRPFLMYYQQSSGYADLLLLSHEGDVVFSIMKKEHLGLNCLKGHFKDTELAKVFDRAKTLMETEISNLRYFPPSKEPAIFIAAPVFKEQIITGVIVLHMSNQEIYNIVNDYNGLGDTGETIIALKIDNQVVVINPLRHEPNAAFRRIKKIGSTEMRPVQDAVQGIKGSGIYVDYREREVLAAWMYLPSPRWGMVVKMDSKEVFAPYFRLVRWSFIIAIAIIVPVIIIAIFVSKSFSAPIVHLTRLTKLVAAGDLKSRIAIKTGNEIGQLADSFNKMTADLKKHRGHLEDLVAERTEELATAKDRAESADRLKSAFLATMSHELRTPLNSIIGFTGIILQGLAGPLSDEQAKQMGMVQNSARHLLALINDVLDISKIEAGQLETVSEPFDMRASIENTARAVTPLAEKKNLRLLVEVAPEVGQVASDRRRVEQILNNLLSNAVKFTDEGGLITLAAKRVSSSEFRVHGSERTDPQPALMPTGKYPVPDNEGTLIEISVQDTGIGIKAEDMDTLFKPFRQIDTGVNRKTEGTGLGLSISKKLVDMLDGEIRVKSEWRKGSRFTVTLPLTIE